MIGPENGKLYLPGLKTEISKANLFVDGQSVEKLNFTKSKDWTILNIPYQKPDELISVIELILLDEPFVDTTLGIDPEIPLVVSTHFSEAQHCVKHKKSWMEKFGEWKQYYANR